MTVLKWDGMGRSVAGPGYFSHSGNPDLWLLLLTTTTTTLLSESTVGSLQQGFSWRWFNDIVDIKKQN